MGLSFPNAAADEKPAPRVTRWDWTPEAANRPIGVARGINPGRVVWARDPEATKWAGHWQEKADQWWTDGNTDQTRVDAMLSATLQKLASAPTDEAAWQAIFRYHNQTARQLANHGYQPGEIVAVKINLNNSSAAKADNQTDATPQMVLAMVRQLVEQAHVPPGRVVVYDVRRSIYGAMITKIWSAYPEVRFVQDGAPTADQPRNPRSGDQRGIEAADWIEGISYSQGSYHEAKLIPRQIRDATYLVNLAILKAHSYPYNYMEDGDEGQTALSMCGKNHFGSIKGTWELHGAINTDAGGTPHAYSPIVDLAASPNLGAKTVLYVLDGLYCGRKWRTYPLHFPNPPFNNRVEPYENPDWPASVLTSLDGVALDSVGLDILFSQTKNNLDAVHGNVPRIMIRENADDYLHEMAAADHPPSGTAYRQDGRTVTSLGVFEHWDSDASRRYSRNLDREHGQGIELIFLPFADAPVAAPSVASAARAKADTQTITLTCATSGARIHFTTDGTVPTDRSPRYTAPLTVPIGAKINAVAVADDRRDSAVVAGPGP
jgi:hypothetical protein